MAVLNLDDFVRITQTTGQAILGRYDGKNYEFPDGVPVDVSKDVAVHLFGFGLPEISDDPRVQDKMPALQRLGWVTMSGDRDPALKRLRTQVCFEEIPPFPTVLRLRQPEESTGVVDSESATRVPSSTPAVNVSSTSARPVSRSRPGRTIARRNLCSQVQAVL